jgi:hypothetical protein
VSAFSDPEIIRMAQKEYIPVVGDDWYQRRRDDPEGRFFRSVADQGPKKGQGGTTRQGVYCLTAAGRLLAYGNNSDPEKMRSVIRKGLAEWNHLPDYQRVPGALHLKDWLNSDARFARQPPTDGLILNVYTRILDHDVKGDFCPGTCKTVGGDRTSRDHMWLTKSDWQSLIPTRPAKGDTFPLPEPVADRLTCFHLMDNTRGEPPFWRSEEIRTQKLNLVIEEVTAEALRMRLEGAVLLATEPDVSRANRGFDVHLLGYLQFDRLREAFDRIDVVAIGEHWGEGTYTKGARPGKTPLGIALELARCNAPANQVPPQGAREIAEYFGRHSR